MGRLTLQRFDWLRRALQGFRLKRLRRKGAMIGNDVQLSLSASIEPGISGGLLIGSHTSIGPVALIDARRPDGSVGQIRIGALCFIGGNAVLQPGAWIGDGVIVAGGAVVRGQVPHDCIVAGNPARVVRRGIGAGRWGRLPDAWDNQIACLGPTGRV